MSGGRCLIGGLQLLAGRRLVDCLRVRPSSAFITPTSSRAMAYWNKDWRPGPFPRTPEERAAAAKKYGLRLEDYEPYPDDGMGYGDYPKLPRISAESRDPREIWDYPELRRNYNEAVHVDGDMLVEDKWNPTTKKRVPFSTMLLWLGGVWGSIMLIYYLTLDYPHFLSVMPKHVPYDGKKHYTFEPAH